MDVAPRWLRAVTEEPARLLDRRSVAAVLAAIAVIYAAALLFADGLGFEPVKDERHFWTSSQLFTGPFPPGLETLRSYPEVVTPLALVLWGQLEHWTGGGIFAGRLLNWFLSLGVVALLVFGAGGRTRRAVLATAGLALFPYFMSLSVHLYTDIPALFFGLLGLHFHTRRRGPWALLFFALAIATRQYMVLLPAAAGADDLLGALLGDRARWRPGLYAAAAAATLLAWFAFFGGLAPAPGIDYWVPRFPAPMLDPLQFMVDYGLYALTGLAVYFVIPEAVLFPGALRRRDLLSARAALCAVAVGIVVLVLGHVLVAHEGGGAFGRTLRFLLPGESLAPVRTTLFAALAVVTIVRFGRRLDLGAWIVLGCFGLSMKSQIPWEKYLLPALGALWYLQSRGLLGVGGETPEPDQRPERSTSSMENGLR
ncbi:MAG: hypothetical protein ACQGVK_15460 [Myxococcota bacterium]